MEENTKTEWCDKTFNPWTLRNGELHRTSAANWKQVEKWNREAAPVQYKNMMHAAVMPDRDGEKIDLNTYIGTVPRPRVFVGSLMDWLDPEVPIEWLADLLDLIRRCPHLDFLLLTKRPELFFSRVRAAIELMDWIPDNMTGWYFDNLPAVPENVWIGTTVEDQKRADERIPALLKIPAKVRFLSCEPLLEEVSLNLQWEGNQFAGPALTDSLHWVICGGESGPNARPIHPDWARSLRDQCKAAGVPFLFKQWGEWGPAEYNPDSGIIMVSGHGKYTSRPEWHKFEDGQRMARIGKKATGRLLDGREWNQFPMEKTNEQD